jgi:peroxiredoxin (alkyl hydroperoxide reductase subunit C)
LPTEIINPDKQKKMAVLVGQKAPQFNAQAVVNGGEFVENFSLDQFLGNKYVVLFFYPKDFTFVCPTELHAFQEKLAEFEARNTAVVAVSTDTEQSHWGWLQIEKNNGGIKGITYPLVADTNKTISANYDVLAGETYYDENDMLQSEGELVAYRGLFLIDKEGIVRHQIVNDLPLGRNVDEAIRMVDALQFNEENGEVCPANWNKGKEGMSATHEGVAKFLEKHMN